MSKAITEIKRRIAENTAEIIRQTKKNSFDLKKFHGADVAAGELSTFTLAAKAFDILAAAHLGALPYLKEKHGADGIMVHGNKIKDVEFKTCARTITGANAFRTKRGAVYVTKADNELVECVKQSECTVLASTFVASFDVKYENNLQSKCRDTYLIAFDEANNTVIDCFMIDGETVVNYLKTSNSIKLGSFIEHGKSVKLSSGPVIGYAKWKEELMSTLTLKSTYK